MNQVSVVLADDHPVVRAGIKAILSSEPDLHVVGEAARGEEIQPLLWQYRPGVLVLDLNMPGLSIPDSVDGLLRDHPGTGIVVLTFYSDDEYIFGLIGLGVRGYVLKDEATDSLVEAVRAVASGRTWFSQAVAGRLARRIAQPDPLTRLTEREREILTLVAWGLSNEDIASSLFIARRTVQNHISSIYGKLGIKSRAEAVLLAVRLGLVNPSEETDSP